MQNRIQPVAAAAIALLFAATLALPVRGQAVVPLPARVKAVWDLDKAWREATPTRERVCLNGLWRWQPTAAADTPPEEGWGYFKVPGPWPGITDYLQKDSQAVYAHPAWTGQKLGGVTAAWYQREIEVPAGWAGRRIALSLEYVNSVAAVFIDGKSMGEVRFPAGEVDLSGVCRPGQKHVLSVRVAALPLKEVMVTHRDTATAREVRGTVPRRGLCGDAYLVSTPTVARLGDVKVDTSVRTGKLTVSATVENPAPGVRYTLRATITDGDKPVMTFSRPAFTAAGLSDSRFAFSHDWKPDRLWDLHTPSNTYNLQVSLLDAEHGAAVLDTSWPERFGFRELWIDGRDFYLNGTRLFLSALPLDNALIGAGQANYAAARETLERLKRIGINCVYTHNYDCTPGAHLSFAEILRAADDVGMLVALTQPHFAQYDWKTPDADANNGYAAHAAFYARVAGNHPSVVFYSTSHNATGYVEDMNPDLTDGLHDPRDQWAANNAKLALRAEAIIRRLDPGRIVYHHAGGNLGAMHTVNFYPNFAPVQELSDWFAHWATAGVKPLFLCEYGAPFTWDWTMYRGWYKGQREFGSAAVPWTFCLAEWDAQFLGDRAFKLGDAEKANLRWEAKQFKEGKVWHRWDYPTQVGSARFDDRNEVLAAYLTDNWRAFRTLGVSGISPWEYEAYWAPRPGVNRRRMEPPVDWEHLQRPGFSPDYLDGRVERIDTAFDEADWIPTAAGRALLRNNQPVLAYIAGTSSAITEKGHHFRPGEAVEKQLVLINNSRRPVRFSCEWSLGLPDPVHGKQEAAVETGQQAPIPLRFELPGTLPPGAYDLRTTVRFGDGEEQADTFTIHVLPPLPPPPNLNIALFDPRGKTAALLERLGVAFRRVDASAALSADDTLVIGKLALTPDGPAPNVSRVREGLKVIVFEQSSQVLERRLGFRVAEYGLRQVFPRVPDHPILNGLRPEHLRDWRGEATTLPPRLTYETRPRYGPTVRWCDIPVTRVWRCGNRGSVASVLIEKPARGDFRPVLDGGFGLQYSPLMEYREGKGMVLFCQMDLTGRSEADPAAELLAANVLRYARDWKAPDHTRRMVYAGEAAGRRHLEALGIKPAEYDGQGALSPGEQVLIVGPGGGPKPGRNEVDRFLSGGGRVMAVALEQADVDALLPFHVRLKTGEHIGAYFDAPGVVSPLAGIAPADVHNRDPRDLSLVSDGATIVGDGVLAVATPDGDRRGSVVFCQLAPWHFDPNGPDNLRRTYRRSAFLLTRLLANAGVAGPTPLLQRFAAPVKTGTPEQRWLDGLYLDTPEEWDDPYRSFRW